MPYTRQQCYSRRHVPLRYSQIPFLFSECFHVQRNGMAYMTYGSNREMRSTLGCPSTGPVCHPNAEASSPFAPSAPHWNRLAPSRDKGVWRLGLASRVPLCAAGRVHSGDADPRGGGAGDAPRRHCRRLRGAARANQGVLLKRGVGALARPEPRGYEPRPSDHRRSSRRRADTDGR